MFGECPDELVLIILSFCHMEDIENTRVWQTEFARHSTVTKIKLEAAKNDSLDNLRWIYGFNIADTQFYEDSHEEESSGKGNNIIEIMF